MTFCKVKVENIRGPMSVSLSGVSILKTISDGNGFRFYPDFSRDIPEISRDIPVSLRLVSVFFRHFVSDPRAQVA